VRAVSAAVSRKSLPSNRITGKTIALHKIRDAGVLHKAAKRDVRRTGSGEANELAIRNAAGKDEAALAVLRALSHAASF
jgi:hypothetical protein